MLSRVKVPVLVTQGREDQLVLPAMSEHTVSAIKHAKGVSYDGVGHSSFYEVPDRFNADLAAFVRSTFHVERGTEDPIHRNIPLDGRSFHISLPHVG